MLKINLCPFSGGFMPDVKVGDWLESTEKNKNFVEGEIIALGVNTYNGMREVILSTQENPSGTKPMILQFFSLVVRK